MGPSPDALRESRPSVTDTTEESRVASILVLELAALGVVGYGLAGMLNEPPADDSTA